jgi:hypothetical protein
MHHCEAIDDSFRKCRKKAPWLCTPEGSAPIYLCERHRQARCPDSDCEPLDGEAPEG